MIWHICQTSLFFLLISASGRVCLQIIDIGSAYCIEGMRDFTLEVQENSLTEKITFKNYKTRSICLLCSFVTGSESTHLNDVPLYL